MMVVIITTVALIGYLALGERYIRLREVCRITYFAGVLVLLLQYGGYLNSLIKEAIN